MHPTVPETLNEVNIMKSVNEIYANTVNTIRNCHRQPSRGMKSRVTILALCTALLLPGIAMAKKPQSTPQAGCSILVDGPLVPTLKYTVKVVRVPSYTGAWHNPTITINSSYDGSGVTNSATIIPGVYNVTYIVNSDLGVPEDAKSGSYATISATVKEPLKKRNTFQETTCSTEAYIQ